MSYAFFIVGLIISILSRVNKATIYYNVGNKEALYALVLNEMFDGGFTDFPQSLSGDKSPEEKLGAYVAQFARAIKKNPRIPRMMMREQVAGGRNMPDSFVERVVNTLNTLNSILEEGARRGVFETVDTLSIHFMILGALMFEATSAPIRQRKAAFPQQYKSEADIFSKKGIEQFTRYLIKAIKKET